jgi:hypothetical protein
MSSGNMKDKIGERKKKSQRIRKLRIKTGEMQK